MINQFPRKKIYICTFQRPLEDGEIVAREEVGNLGLDERLVDYSEDAWERESRGKVSSEIASAVSVKLDPCCVIVNCGLTGYKNLIGQFKRARENKQTDGLERVHGLSTEILPITNDERVIFEQRDARVTDHGVGFYDIPTAGQSAQMYVETARKDYPGLVNNEFDLFGLAKYNLIRHLGVEIGEIGEDLAFVGFSRGFEVSIDSQFNGFCSLNLESGEIERRTLGNESHRLVYGMEDILGVFDSIGKTTGLKEDVHGNVPGITKMDERFRMVDNCLGTLLSVLWHKHNESYGPAKQILEGKGYEIQEVHLKMNEVLNLDTLN
jgi:hypothetical protein